MKYKEQKAENWCSNRNRNKHLTWLRSCTNDTLQCPNVREPVESSNFNKTMLTQVTDNTQFTPGKLNKLKLSKSKLNYSGSFY